MSWTQVFSTTAVARRADVAMGSLLARRTLLIAIGIAMPMTVFIAPPGQAQDVIFSAGFETGTVNVWSSINPPDTVPPVLTLTSPGPVAPGPRPEITVSMVDNLTGIDRPSATLSLDGVDILASCTVRFASITCTPSADLADGPHTIAVTVADGAGNVASLDDGFSVESTDTTPPSLAFTAPSPPDVGTIRPTISLAYDDDRMLDLASLRLTVDGLDQSSGCARAATAADCVVGPLAAGTRTLEATIADLAGNEATASLDLDVDLAFDNAPPTIAVIAPGANVVDDITPAFIVQYQDLETGIDAGSVSLTLDTAPLSGCLITATETSCEPPALAAGMHTIGVQVADLAGNPATASHTFELTIDNPDTVAPTLTVAQPGAIVFGTDAPDVRVTFADGGTVPSGVDLATFTATIDGMPITAGCLVRADDAFCSAPALSVGMHDLEAFIDDFAGNRGSVLLSFEVADDDQAAPTIAITAPLGTLQDERQPEIVITYSDAIAGIDETSLQVTLDGADIVTACETVTRAGATCESPVLDAGTHTLDVSIADLAGNVGTAQATFDLQLTDPDDVAPTLAIDQPGGGVVTEPRPAVALSYADAGSGIDTETLAVAIDGEELECTATATSATCDALTLAAGDHELQASIQDLAGNLATAARSFQVDPQPDVLAPEIAILDPEPGTVVGPQTVRIGYRDLDSGLDVDSLVLVIDGTDVSTSCSRGSSTAVCGPLDLAVGAHDLTASIRDNAGNTGMASVAVDAIDRLPDTRAPVLRLVQPVVAELRGDLTPRIAVSYTDAESGIDIATLAILLDGADLTSSCTVGFATATCESPTLEPGPHRIEASVADVDGNTSTFDFDFQLEFGIGVTITAPAAGLLTGLDRVDVEGEIAAGPGGATADQVMVAGIQATIAGTTFTASDVPLEEGNNLISAVASTIDGGVGTASIAVIRDTTAPRVVIQTPPDGFVTASSQIVVAGEVADGSSSNVRAEELTVSVGGIEAAIEQRSFVVDNFLLQPGENLIDVVCLDHAGNETTSTVRVIFDPTLEGKLEELLGNAQRASVGETLEHPLIVRVVDGLGRPLSDREVTFEISRGDGTLLSFPETGTSLVRRTDEAGLAQVGLTVGTRAGGGNTEVVASSPGFPNEIVFCASADAGVPTRLVPIMGSEQTGTRVGLVGQTLANPLLVQVFDMYGNPVPNAPVRFQVTLGDGVADAGGGAPGTDVETVTDADGKASVMFTLGTDTGTNSHEVLATLVGIESLEATFQISGVALAAEAETRLSGVVMSNDDLPVPGATIRVPGTGLETVTDADGQFQLSGIAAGTLHFDVDGSTVTLPGTWTSLEFEIDALPGQDNNLGRPIRILPLDMAGSAVVGGAEDVTLRMAGVPGAELTVLAGSTTFPDGASTGVLSVTQVHSDKVPMVPPMGSDFMLAWTIQPAGVLFDPPAQLTIPNNGLAPGTTVDIFSFDHDLGEFVPIGTAAVTEDGAQISSKDGFGVVKSGWHGCVPPPAPPGDGCGEGTCTICVDGRHEPRCDKDCEDCGMSCPAGAPCRMTCTARMFPEPELTANDKKDDEDPVSGIDEEVEFGIENLGDLQAECSDLKLTWTIPDDENGGNVSPEPMDENPVQEFKKEGTKSVSVMVECMSCSSMPSVMGSIEVEVIDVPFNAEFNALMASPEMMDEKEEDLDGDGVDDKLFRVLGGYRFKLMVEEPPMLMGKVRSYKWEADSGEFYDKDFDDDTAKVVSGSDLEGPMATEFFWQGEWTTSQEVELKVTLELDDGQDIEGKRILKSRLLQSDPSMTEDDVKMLQAALFLFGHSTKSTPGVTGTPVAIDGQYGPGTTKAVERFQKNSQIGADGKVGNGTLMKLEEHATDFTEAYLAYDSDGSIDTGHGDFNTWATAAAGVMDDTYNDTFRMAASGGVTYETLIEKWIEREIDRFGHWGYRSRDHRLTLSTDGFGSLGFSQVLMRYKYGSGTLTGISALNLYHPEENVTSLATFQNETSHNFGSGGFHYAFTLGSYTVTDALPMQFPRLVVAGGGAYTDTEGDRFAKGVMAFNRGSAFVGSRDPRSTGYRGVGGTGYNVLPWPWFFVFTPPPASPGGAENCPGGRNTVPHKNCRGMDYSIDVQQEAGYPVLDWDWEDVAITTGADNVCDSVPGPMSNDVIVPHDPMGPTHQVCIVGAPGRPLETMPAGNDTLGTWTFNYTQLQWLGSTSWATQREMSRPMRITP